MLGVSRWRRRQRLCYLAMPASRWSLLPPRSWEYQAQREIRLLLCAVFSITYHIWLLWTYERSTVAYHLGISVANNNNVNVPYNQEKMRIFSDEPFDVLFPVLLHVCQTSLVLTSYLKGAGWSAVQKLIRKECHLHMSLIGLWNAKKKKTVDEVQKD